MSVSAQTIAPASVPSVPEHQLLRPIAAGAYGQVWLARNALGIYRAVKLVRRASFEHERPFEREFAGIKAFEPISRAHEGLVNLLQAGRDNGAGYFYYVMELADDLNSQAAVRGGDHALESELDSYMPRTLGSELKRRGRLPLEECIRIGLSLSQALAYLHERKLVHRDVKPSNIIFVRGMPKLADVGLVIGAGDSHSFVGTEGFIAPEGPGTPQADLYSLGIVLYVISTGNSHQAFPEPIADLAGEPEHARWLEFNLVIDKACRAQARERYQGAQQMHEELALLEQGASLLRRRAAQRRGDITRKAGLVALVPAVLLMISAWLRPAPEAHLPAPDVKRLYELGQWYYGQLMAGAHKKALEYLTQTVQKDPEFVKPYRELIAIYVWGRQGVVSGQDSLQKTKEIADKLLAKNPRLAEGHAALSWHKFLNRDWRAAEQEIKRAIQLDPDYPMARDVYSFYLSVQGRTVEARRQVQRSQALDPTSRMSGLVASWPFISERRLDLAIAQLKQVVELDRNFAEAHNFLGKCYEAQSNYVAAIEEFTTSDLLAGNDPTKVSASYAALRQAYDAEGGLGYYRKWIELIHADETLPPEKRIFYSADLASCLAELGQKQQALDELEKHFDEPGVWAQLNFEPEYESLHDEPRFHALLKRAGLEQ